MEHIQVIETILFVDSQETSTAFYSNIFRKEPELNVPGMTEFKFSENFKVGLMPNRGIAKILNGKTQHPETANGVPRCELYMHVENIQEEFDNAIRSGAKLISKISERNWGDKACYFADPDGHIIAFAERITQ